MKITIVGLPGSGKSTLAQKMVEKEHISHIHIDRFWLENGGGHNSRTTSNPEQVHARVKEEVLKAIQADSWVSDGLYPLIQPEVMERADTIIFLDIPLWRRLLNHAKRIMGGKGHKGTTLWGNLQFFSEMVGRGSTKVSRIESLLEPFRAKTVVLSTKSEVENYLETLRR